MAEVSGVITVNKFVAKMLFKSGKNDDEHLRYLQIALDGLKQLFLQKVGYITNTKATIDTDTNTVDLPDDFMGLISLSIPDSGRMWTLTRDDSLIPTTSLDINSDEYLDTDDGEGVDLSEEYVPIGYGARGGYNDWYYTLDLKKRRIIVSGRSVSHVIIRYVSSGINATEATEIPLSLEPVLEAWLFYKISEYNDEHRGIVGDKYQAYNRELRKFMKQGAPALYEIKDAIMSTASQSIRR
jgi:hypothetical protein